MPTHTRIRMFNTKDTYPNQSLDNDLCQAVRAGNTVYVRGQVGTDFDGQLVGLGDPRAQAEQAMRSGVSGTPSVRLHDRQTAQSILLKGPIEGDLLLSAMDMLAAGDPAATPTTSEMPADVVGDMPR